MQAFPNRVCRVPLTPAFYRPPHIARLIGYSYKQILRLIHAGRIHALRARTGKFLIPHSELQRLLNLKALKDSNA